MIFEAIIRLLLQSMAEGKIELSERTQQTSLIKQKRETRDQQT